MTTHRRWQQSHSRKVFDDRTRATLLKLLDADRAQIVSEAAYANGAGLERLLHDVGDRGAAIRMIKAVLKRAAVNGGASSASVGSWDYFRSAIEEELAQKRGGPRR